MASHGQCTVNLVGALHFCHGRVPPLFAAENRLKLGSHVAAELLSLKKTLMAFCGTIVENVFGISLWTMWNFQARSEINYYFKVTLNICCAEFHTLHILYYNLLFYSSRDNVLKFLTNNDNRVLANRGRRNGKVFADHGQRSDAFFLKKLFFHDIFTRIDNTLLVARRARDSKFPREEGGRLNEPHSPLWLSN